MKHGEATVSAGKTAISSARAGAVAGILLVAGLLPLPLGAAIDRYEPGSVGTRVVIDSKFPPVVAVDNDDTLPPANDQTPALVEDVPKVPQALAEVTGPSSASPSDAQSPASAKDAAAKDFDAALFPPKELGLMDRVQDWLARANREFQFTIIRRLSTAPAGGGGDDIARKLEDVKEEDAEAAADRAEEAIKAAQAKQAAEAKHRQELADAAEKAAERTKAQEPRSSAPQVVPKPDDSAALAEEMRKERQRLEAEAQRIEDQRKLAEQKLKADEQKRLEDLRVAAQAKLAEQKAAEAKAKAAEEASAQKAAKEVASAKEKEFAAQQAAEARHQRELADAAEKAAEEAKRLAAREEAAKAAATKEAKEAADKAAQEAAAKEAEAKRVAEKKAEQKQAMVEDEDKEDKGDANTADAAPEAAPSSDNPAGTDQPDAKPEERASGDANKTVSEPAAHRAHAYRIASNHLARGPVVKRWIRRARQGRCRYAGRKILVPGLYTVARGDTLSLISLRHYQTSRYSLRIYRANRKIIRDPNFIYPCQRLYLPRRRG